MILVNITFTHTDDPYLTNVPLQVLPREEEDFAIMPSGDPDEPYLRIDKVTRVRHYVVSAEGAAARTGGHLIELILDRR